MFSVKFAALAFLVGVLGYVNGVATQRAVAGGKSSTNVEDAKIQEMAAFAVSELGDQYSLADITAAETQVSRHP